MTNTIKFSQILNSIVFEYHDITNIAIYCPALVGYSLKVAAFYRL